MAAAEHTLDLGVHVRRREPRHEHPLLELLMSTITTTSSPGRDLVVGDVIVFLGTEHRVDRFEPYTGILLPILGEGTRVAHSGPTWAMTVTPDDDVRHLPRPAGGAA